LSPIRVPTRILIIDANIVLNAALGLRSRPLVELVAARRVLVTTSRAQEEVFGLAASLGERASAAAGLAVDVLSAITVLEEPDYANWLEAAALSLRLAPASRNGSTADAHILALAWTLEADIWSHDRDFAGTGWPSWSTANLRAALVDT
jgi:predicted nucleic acid-binding protein